MKKTNRNSDRVKSPRAARVRQATPRFETPMFINIDLDIRSRRSLAPLVAVWPWAQQPLRTEGRPNPHWLLLSAHANAKTAEGTARALLEQIETLAPRARRCWNLASMRTFDIGVQAGVGPRPFEEVQLTPETLGRIASIGARLQLTVYPPQPA